MVLFCMVLLFNLLMDRLLLVIWQIKDEIRKPVYCELLGLLQDKDLAVKVCFCYNCLILIVNSHLVLKVYLC